MSNFCPNCGNFIENGVCEKCGNFEVVKNYDAFPETKKKKILPLIIALGLVFIIPLVINTLLNKQSKETENYKTSVISAETIMDRCNNNIKLFNPELSHDNIELLRFSFLNKEFSSDSNYNTYVYSSFGDLIKAVVFEDADTGNAVFGGVSIETELMINVNSTAKIFKNDCYCFAKAFDTTLSEKDMTDIWNKMENDEEGTTTHGDYMYTIYGKDGNFTFMVEPID